VTAQVIDAGLLTDVQRFGAADVSACFSCGVCTATCPLAENDAAFPRRLIRYAEVGMRESLLSSKELWTCYHCGECSDTCPTEADPAGFMAAARRWAIASYDRTQIARTIYTRPLLGASLAILVALFFALFMLAQAGPQSGASLALFQFIPEELIHLTGLAVMAIVFVAGLAGVATMVGHVARAEQVGWRDLIASRQALGRSVRALWFALGLETLGQRRFRVEGDEVQRAVPWYRRRWLLHALTMWGFLGLLAATMLDYGLAIVGIKATGTPVPIWHPIRLLGTLAGIALLYGTSWLIVDRLTHADRSSTDSQPSDWLFLALLWTTGVTGFLIELALYLPQPPSWGYWIFLVHVAIAMELVLLAPFMKFAHAAYRPVALFFLALRPGYQQVPGHHPERERRSERGKPRERHERSARTATRDDRPDALAR
jgi:quinone-modifying oxidoreductase, subunit QmoC